MMFRFLFLSLKGENNMYLMHKNKFVAKLTTYQGVVIRFVAKPIGLPVE